MFLEDSGKTFLTAAPMSSPKAGRGSMVELITVTEEADPEREEAISIP